MGVLIGKRWPLHPRLRAMPRPVKQPAAAPQRGVPEFRADLIGGGVDVIPLHSDFIAKQHLLSRLRGIKSAQPDAEQPNGWAAHRKGLVEQCGSSPAIGVPILREQAVNTKILVRIASRNCPSAEFYRTRGAWSQVVVTPFAAGRVEEGDSTASV